MNGKEIYNDELEIPKGHYQCKRGLSSTQGKTDSSLRVLTDGKEIVMVAHIMTYSEFMDELEENECFGVCEVFHTVKGNKFLYARDEEGDDDYLIKIEV